MLNTFKEIPSIETGYLLEVDKGWFSVVSPVEKENFILNPNFINFLSNEQVVPVNALVALLGDGVFAPSALDVAILVPGLGTRELKFNVDFSLVGTYTFSCYLRADMPGTVELIIGDATNPTQAVEVTSSWERYSFTSYVNTTVTPYFSVWSDEIDFQITSVQAEEGMLTTFFSGDTDIDLYDGPNAYQWTGTPNDSTSVRSADAFSGGELVSLFELGFKITSIEGLGYPDLSPILHEQALFDQRLFSCSNIEPREIVLNGVLLGCSYEEFICSRGMLGQLLFQVRRPIRIYYTPYTHCNDIVPCLYFDFVYTTGLNEEINSLYGQELSIEGITLDPCISSCSPYSYSQATMEDYFITVTTGGRVGLITDDNQFIAADIPRYIAGGGAYETSVTKAVECNGAMYAIVRQITATLAVDVVVKYQSGVWTEILRSDIFMSGGALLGQISTIECVQESALGGLYIGGFFDSNISIAFGPDMVGTVIPGPNIGGLIRYDLETNIAYMYEITYAAEADGTGLGAVTAIYNYDGRTYFGGFFDRVVEPDFSVIYTVVDCLFYIFHATSTYDMGDFGVVGTGGSDSTIPININGLNPQVYGFYGDGERLYVLSNVYNEPYDISLNSQAFLHDYELDLEQYQTVSHPFASGPTIYDASGTTNSMFKHGNQYFISGKFEQATSNFNNPLPIYINISDWIINVGVFDPTGYNEPQSAFIGGFAPLQWSRETVNSLATASGVYGSTSNEALPIANTANGVQFAWMHGTLLIFGGIVASGLANDKEVTCGVIAYKPLSETNLTHGVFLPPTIEMNAGASCWAYIKLFEGLYGINGLVSGSDAFGVPFNDTMYYNAGITVDTCDDQYAKDAILIVDTDAGVLDVSGVRNLTTGRDIYFEPVNLVANDIVTFQVVGQTIQITRANGVNISTVDILNTGNPLQVRNGDVVQLIFSMNATHDIIPNNNPTFTLQTKKCYMSFDEVVVCEECTDDIIEEGTVTPPIEQETFDYEEWPGEEQPVDTITPTSGIIRFGYTPYLGNGSTIA